MLYQSGAVRPLLLPCHAGYLSICLLQLSSACTTVWVVQTASYMPGNCSDDHSEASIWQTSCQFRTIPSLRTLQHCWECRSFVAPSNDVQVSHLWIGPSASQAQQQCGTAASCAVQPALRAQADLSEEILPIATAPPEACAAVDTQVVAAVGTYAPARGGGVRGS